MVTGLEMGTPVAPSDGVVRLIVGGSNGIVVKLKICGLPMLKPCVSRAVDAIVTKTSRP